MTLPNGIGGTAGSRKLRPIASCLAILLATTFLHAGSALAADYAAGGGVNNAPSGFATAVGPSATTEGTFAAAYGYSATATGENAVSMGALSTATGNNATAIGIGTTAAGLSASAFGDNATATGATATAAGNTSRRSTFCAN